MPQLQVSLGELFLLIFVGVFVIGLAWASVRGEE